MASVAAGSITLTIEEQPFDTSSVQRAYIVRVKNDSSNPILIAELKEQVPKGITVDSRDASQNTFSVTNQSIREDISALINRYTVLALLKTAHDKPKEPVSNNTESILVGTYSHSKSFLLVSKIYSLLTGGYVETDKTAEQLRRHMLTRYSRVGVRNNREVRNAIRIWFPKLLEPDCSFLETYPPDEASILKSLRFKLEALKIITLDGIAAHQDESSSRVPSGSLLAPGQEMSKSIVLAFPKHSFLDRKYTFEYLVTYLELPSTLTDANYHEITSEDGSIDDSSTQSLRRKTIGASLLVGIGSATTIASIIAIISSLLGLFLNTKAQDSFIAFIQSIGNPAIYKLRFDWIWITTPVIAFFFLNLYDKTDLRKQIVGLMNWRIAVLVGLLSAIAGDKIISALKALVGS